MNLSKPFLLVGEIFTATLETFAAGLTKFAAEMTEAAAKFEDSQFGKGYAMGFEDGKCNREDNPND